MQEGCSFVSQPSTALYRSSADQTLPRVGTHVGGTPPPFQAIQLATSMPLEELQSLGQSAIQHWRKGSARGLYDPLEPSHRAVEEIHWELNLFSWCTAWRAAVRFFPLGRWNLCIDRALWWCRVFDPGILGS